MLCKHQANKSWGINFKVRNMTRDKSHFIVMKGSIHYKDIAILSLHTHDNIALKYTKMLKFNKIKEEIDQFNIIINFNIHLSV